MRSAAYRVRSTGFPGVVVAALVLAVLAVVGLAACGPRHAPVTALPLPSASPTLTASAAASVAVSPTDTPRTVRTTVGHSPGPTGRALGDLTIHLAGFCVWYQDSLGELWLDPTLAATWSGSTAFPSNGFSMTANYGKHTAGGPVTSAAPFTWAIGGEATAGNAFLGHTVKLTVTIDAAHTVAETNETNNTTVITVIVPLTPPPASGTELTVPCG